MDYEIISTIIVYLLVFLIIYKNRKKFQVMDKIFFVYKNNKMISYFEKLASCTWLWKIISTIGLLICFYFIIFSINMFIQSSTYILNTLNPQPTVALLIPGVTKDPLTGETIPIIDLFLILGIIIIIHESMHGIIGLSEKIKMKSAGVGLLAVIPMAFVEPDQESYEKSKKISKLRMLIAGSFGNIVFAFIVVLISGFLLTPFISSKIVYSNLSIVEVIDLPANLSGIPVNVSLYSVGEYVTSNASDLYKALALIPVNETINITTSNGTFLIKTMESPYYKNMSYLGIKVTNNWDYSSNLSDVEILIVRILIRILEFLNLLANLSLSIGIMNLFPLWITDGGKVVLELIEPIIKDKKKSMIIANYLYIFCLSLLLFNLFGPYLINLYTAIKPLI
ncbi:MAG: site-2 protease family protein [Candidatus Nanoarchaeia archaeon]|nr:site-2 protease family protein [Candidatus Nanoarchaeia archaeon]